MLYVVLLFGCGVIRAENRILFLETCCFGKPFFTKKQSQKAAACACGVVRIEEIPKSKKQ